MTDASGSDAVLHLASASPRRRDILDSLGIRYTWGAVGIDESAAEGEAPDALVRRLAREKALAAESVLPVLAADTIVTLEGRIFGKPASQEEALAILAALSGRTHRVLTAVALVAAGRLSTTMSDTRVQFREIDPDEARAYWQSGEPGGKAGAYAIQGRGGIFVQSVTGSYSGVVGLPVFETAALLGRAGIDVLSRRA